jgi:hypothetical protein
VRFASVRLTEGFAAAFERRSPQTDAGTRLLVRYAGFPAGARLFTPGVVVGSNGATPTSAGDLGLPVSGGRYFSGAGGQLLLARVQNPDMTGAGGTPVFTPSGGVGAMEFDQLVEVPLVNGAGQTGASVITDGWTAGDTLNLGDVVQFAGVYQVNVQSRQSTGTLQDFVVTATTASSGGAMTIPISPSIVTSGATQTVSASPADNAVVTLFSAVNTYSAKTSPTGLGFHRDAFTLVTADLPLPGGVDMAARVSDKQLGVSIRMVRAYDINNDQFPCRLDVLYGWATLRPELAARIQG